MTGKSGTKRRAPVVSAPVAALAQAPVGPELAALLASLTLETLTGYETVLVVKARFRQVNHERGMFLTSIGEVMRRKDPSLSEILCNCPTRTLIVS